MPPKAVGLWFTLTVGLSDASLGWDHGPHSTKAYTQVPRDLRESSGALSWETDSSQGGMAMADATARIISAVRALKMFLGHGCMLQRGKLSSTSLED